MHSVSAFICPAGKEQDRAAKRLVHLTLHTKPGQPVTRSAVRAAVDSNPATAGQTVLTINYGEFFDVPFSRLNE